MAPAILGMDAPSLFRVVIDALERLPGSVLIDTDRWIQLKTPSSQSELHNKVLLVRSSPEAGDELIAKTVAEHEARGAHFKWLVGPGSTPDDLSSRLETLGLIHQGEGRGMVRDTEPLSIPGEVHVRLATPHDIDDVVRLIAVNTKDASPGFEAALRNRIDRDIHGSRGVTQWIATVEGEPVGVSALRVLPGIGYLQGASVIAAHRGRGFYVAMTEARLCHLRRLGIQRVAIWADARTSGPIAERMGFARVKGAVFQQHHGGPVKPSRSEQPSRGR